MVSHFYPFIMSLLFVPFNLMAEDGPFVTKKHLAIFDRLVVEIERIDGEGLAARKNRPEKWPATIKKLRSELENALSPIDVGQVFRKLDAAYPNLHAQLVLLESYDLAAGRVRAVIPARFGPEVVQRNQKNIKFKISTVESDSFKNSGDNKPMVGDEIVSINGKMMKDWLKENLNYCKFPLEEQCHINLFDNLRKGLLSWDWRSGLSFVLKRGSRTWSVEIPFVVPSPEAIQSSPHRATETCHDELSRYPDFEIVHKGMNLCAFESRKYPGTTVLKIISFAYREIAKDSKIQTLKDEVDQFYLSYWKEKSRGTRKLIIDLIDNGGGDTPVPWYEIFYSQPFQETFVQFKKTPELEDSLIRKDLFYGDHGKEIWYQDLKKSGALEKIKYGSFLPPVPQFCANNEKNCSKDLFKPRAHQFKGQVRLMVNEWCISSCTGFVWSMKDQLKSRVKIIGLPDSGDSAYARLFLDLYEDKKSPEGFRLTVSPRTGRTKQRLPEGAILRQQVTATRSTDSRGRVISAIPSRVDVWIPYRFRHFDESWENKTFQAALKN